MTAPLDITGLDAAVLEDFQSKEDLRSYFSVKYGHEYAEKIVRAVETCGLCQQDRESCQCSR